MSEQDALGTGGIWHGPNELSEVPASAYVTMDNCVIRAKGVIEPRKGHAEASNVGSLGTPNAARRVKAMGTLEAGTGALMGNVIAHAGTDVLTGSSVIATSTSAPDETIKRMAFATGAERCYFTTSTGVRRYDGSTVAASGGLFSTIIASKNALPVGNQFTSDVNGFLPVNSAVRYVSTITTVDSQGREIVGPASAGAIFINPAAQVVAIAGLVRTGGNLVTVTCATPHNFSIGMPFTITPGEANFAAAAHTVLKVTSSLVFTYSDAGANVASTAQQTLSMGTAHVTVPVAWLPGAGSTSSIVRVYRSTVTATAAIIPSEDCYLVWEGSPSAGNVTAGFMPVTDNTPEVMMGPIGYFSPSAETRLQTNGVPPLAQDIARFGDSMFYGRTIEPHALTVRLLATGGSDGLVTGSTFNIVVSGVTTTYTASNIVTSGFALYNTSSVALDCQRTAMGLVDAINASGPCWAEYISSVDDAPGQFRLTLRTFSTTGFSVWSDKPDAFNPGLPTATPKASSQENRKARVWWSKPGLPDAVPPLNFNDVGDGDEAVLRVIELRDQLFIIKENSVWIVSGSYGRYSFNRLDDTMVPAGADTFCVVSGQIYGLATQGVVTISPTGVGLVGLPLAPDFEDLLQSLGLASNNPISLTRRLAWGAAYETDHLYLLGLPGGPQDATCRNVWVFSTLAKAWMRWPLAYTCAASEQKTDALLFGDALEPSIRYEFPRQYDKALAAEITGSSANTDGTWNVSMLDASFIEAGDYLAADGLSPLMPSGIVLSVSGNICLVGGSADWTPGAATVGKAFECVLEPVPFFMGQPGHDKMAQEVALLFKDANFRLFEVSVGSDMSPTQLASRVCLVNGYGESAWGASGWGNRHSPHNERLLVPRNAARGHYFYIRATIREATRWKLNGMSVLFDMNDAKGKR